KSIATVDVSFTVDEQDIDDELMIGHWKNFLDSVDDLSATHHDLLYNQTPSVYNKSIMLTSRNEAEAQKLKKRILDSFQTYCKKIAAHHYTLTFEEKIEESAIQQLRRQKEKEDKQLVKKTM